ncbi:hypothetical protein CO057_04220 [Candidatus Uhrbacteria bacterium CG_4_9_14_0_2_um_filter_41_50]|uniref:Uncharacterized protein n=1 Tax=Candidatus Uhrbacteria bacterium CG_4_9_14_0_2_um_filter_41_50 TaxID=1975031 RepID=A0A2M8EN64_9BACT|nr:MAG: hypothetical protein COZ45_03450 [Candidatus Uhrbacteria bacterium CG_4_10_14_3_um_filter_41_21]PIZ55040.1 MAG: hypothetical protein COY24_01865 [Candidatus Uhrbacteria bacterium CG_4_10_14_0_2_um_filter_41_21]PJB84309.1 MAG: hypothetical protein CO086_04255 [Candidatus Uhrbacteria bacterium CG_4_9_14_0_8_um_filter_41_16]PJC24174.1 MAG: hypothetical protein CO057_04220 [Candidatus Uhrbacteria bacterium CG_4_9_14_0_2_um_filter_41_50]
MRETYDPMAEAISKLYEIRDERGLDLEMKGGEWVLRIPDSNNTATIKMEKDGRWKLDFIGGLVGDKSFSGLDIDKVKLLIDEAFADRGKTQIGGPGFDAKVERAKDRILLSKKLNLRVIQLKRLRTINQLRLVHLLQV